MEAFDSIRVNDLKYISIGLASPEKIRKWSRGEVKKPETINYRTYRPEKEGIFCEKIFGPEKDYECHCGQYNGIKYKDVTCPRCGVRITVSTVRRYWMGHINLAAPVIHIWFFRSVPSRLSVLLDIPKKKIKDVIYYQKYIVIDSQEPAIKEGDLLTPEEYVECVQTYGRKFTAKMGAEAIRDLIRKIDFKKEADDLRAKLALVTGAGAGDAGGGALRRRRKISKQRLDKYFKRLQIVEGVVASDGANRPEWMVMDVIPVIPPDLRPLVHLESGNFATSDLNDLYRRVINRNNRIKKLIELSAPEVIIRNEKRMLQQAVDALFDNSRCQRTVLGPGRRPLKSLADILKGKRGRFRENLLGKRVDYSARSVIAVGPHLKIDQCGLPKEIAFTLMKPFVLRKLIERGEAMNNIQGKKMLEQRDDKIWDIMDEVIREKVVLLNRAPTLHRIGVQAFKPTLIEGNAITIPPMICEGFNADFDGDQMAVHLPLSTEAQTEACLLMLSSNNIFSPAHGGPIIKPTQDIVMGLYYLTVIREDIPKVRLFASAVEARTAFDHGKLALQDKIGVRFKEAGTVVYRHGEEAVTAGQIVHTTVGRIIMNGILPAGAPFYNMLCSSDVLKGIIQDCFKRFKHRITVEMLYQLQVTGFQFSTRSGLSFGIDDLVIPKEKEEILKQAFANVRRFQKQSDSGLITNNERYNKVIDQWTHATELMGEALMKDLAGDRRGGKNYLNPIFVMADSGARGSKTQIRQLSGMRGLMAKPSGEIIERPITTNFKEGLTALEYFSSTHGARKGLADTALKTADAGYLTRKLVDVCQNVVITEEDCGTVKGVTRGRIEKGSKEVISLFDAILGRVSHQTIATLEGDVIVREGEIITEEVASRIEAYSQEHAGFKQIQVRSPLTCESVRGICQKCYGMDHSTKKVAEIGLATGVIAAQSIGEPGTQLTMRTFHIGGIGTRVIEETQYKALNAGTLVYDKHMKSVEKLDEKVWVALSSNGKLLIVDDQGRVMDSYNVPNGAKIFRPDGAAVHKGEKLVEWDIHNTNIYAREEGTVRYKDIHRNETYREEIDPKTGVVEKVIMELKSQQHPEIVIEGPGGHVLNVEPLPETAHILVDEGRKVKPWELIAKIPKGVSGTQDITGGLPRVTELFEARVPKDAAVMSEIDGVVEIEKEYKRNKRVVKVVYEGMAKGGKKRFRDVREYFISPRVRLVVQAGQRVNKGDNITPGARDPHEILRIMSEDKLHDYLIDQVQQVYRLQGVKIADKHIEIVVRQMLRVIEITDPGDTRYLPGDRVSRYVLDKLNHRLAAAGKRPAEFRLILMGVSKAALNSESFISAASFQRTTQVLTEAALKNACDYLYDLKSNVIIGRLIPAGTSFPTYINGELEKEIPKDLGGDVVEAVAAGEGKQT
ncbi:MAG: DNA-directed RNA polymerase subunit beta' [Planctomycetota bacterium]